MKLLAKAVAPVLLAATALKQAIATEETQSHSSSLLRRQMQFQEFAEKTDWSAGEVDVSELQITDEREGQAFCSFLVDTFESTINSVSPFDFDCNCRLQIFRARIAFDCGSTVCVDDIEDLTGVSANLPIVGEYCVNPTWSGTLRLLRQTLASTLCSGSDDITMSIPELEETVGFEISDDETVTFDLPNVCVAVESPEGGQFTSVTSCSVTIDGVDCPCEVCGDAGQDIRLMCPEVMDPFIPEVLDPVLELTDACIGLSLVNGGGGGDGGARESGNPTIVGPLLQIKDSANNKSA